MTTTQPQPMLAEIRARAAADTAEIARHGWSAVPTSLVADRDSLLAALDAVLAVETTPVGPDMEDVDVDQAEGWNDAVREVRRRISAHVELGSGESR